MKKTLLAMAAFAATVVSAPAMATAGLAPAPAQPVPQGPITRDTYAALQKKLFTVMDSNHDGFLSKAEISAFMTAKIGQAPPDRVAAMFKLLDTNGDGKVSQTEALSVAMARFNALDANHDGILTPEERRAAMASTTKQQ